MKRTIIFIVPIFILIIFTSCAHQTRYINPDYSERQITNAVLLLPQFENCDFIENDTLFNELDIYNTKEEYFSYFMKNIEQHINDQSTFNTIKYIRYDTQPEYETRTLNLNKKEKFTFDLPLQPIQLDISDPVFILFFEDLLLSFSKKTKEATTSTRSYNVSGITDRDMKLHAVKNFKYYITLQSKYVLYDNNTGELVACGTASTKERYESPAPVEDIIKRMIRDFSGEIFQKTPFEK